MAEQFIYKLRIDDVFRKLISPLSKEEHQQLEQNIVRDGCREPLSVWNNMILDGHNRYEICLRQHIPFMIHRIYLRNREEAIAWICANQLGRRNITEETRKYLIGKRYEMEKIIGAHNAAGTNQHTKKVVRAKMLNEPPFNESALRTSERLGEEYRISHATVAKYGTYANALDSLSKTMPDLLPKILSGELKISHENIIDMSRLSEQNTKRLGHLISDDDTKFAEYLCKVLPKKQDPAEKLVLPIASGCVKNMPAYDPDAEISSLVLTIPSWVMSINRAHSMTDFSAITYCARQKLEKELIGLKETIVFMLAAIQKEDT